MSPSIHCNSYRLFRWLALIAGAVILASCASTTLQTQWRDPAYTGGAFKRVFVVGLSARDGTARRVLEDVLVAKLKAGGVEAVPGWQFLSDAPMDEAAFAAAVGRSGADSMLMVRLLGVETQTTVWPPMGPRIGWYGAYSGWYAYPDVTQTQTAVVETTFFDTKTRRVVWSGTSETLNPTSVAKDAPAFADVILGALSKDALLAWTPPK
jgi:opacity protein-like surface antigen